MDKRSLIRWVVLLSALAATIVAIFYPTDEPFQARPSRPSVAKPVARAAFVTIVKTPGRPVWVASDENPFASRVWEAPPPPVAESPRAVQLVDTTQPAAEQPPPPLPYRFLGQMQDGGERVLYLGHGEQVLLARQGDVLESTYKVVAVNDGMIEFESVQSGARQTLPIPAQ
jgi:hypothetical protein